MNPYTVIILGTMLFRFVLDFFSNLFNLKRLQPAAPSELADLYDPEQYRKSQEYTRTRTNFHFVESTFDLAVTLAFWFSGGFEWLDEIVRGWNFSPIWTGLLYIGILALASAILSLPFSIYSTFVIEERYGFNRTKPKTFVADILKGLVLAVILGGVLLGLILWLFHTRSSAAWLLCWITTTIFGLFVQYLAPVWIMPLFNKFEPLQEGELKQAIHDYATRVGFAYRDISVMDGSKRSSKANAFFTGFGKNKRIALFDTLVSEQTQPELLAVLAHEIGHYKKKHILQGTILGILQTGVLFYLLSIFVSSPGLFEAFRVQHISVYAGIVFFGMLYQPISFVLSIALHAFSRHNEFSADQYSVETGQNPENLISSLKKLSVKNLSNLTPHPLYVFLHYSHPPLLERIYALHNVSHEPMSRSNAR